MLAERKLALFLFVSLGFNVFLGSVLGANLLFGREEQMANAPKETGAETASPQTSGKERDRKPGKLRQPHLGRADTRQQKGDGPRHRGGPRDPKTEGPSDLFLLRQMIRIMGGPKDPRIFELREERRDEIQRIRSEMQEAHARVHGALTSDQLDEAELKEALKNLRKTAFESQARAQEGILNLAKLMTPEERAALRQLRPEKNRRVPDGRPSREKTGPEKDKGPADLAP